MAIGGQSKPDDGNVRFLSPWPGFKTVDATKTRNLSAGVFPNCKRIRCSPQWSRGHAGDQRGLRTKKSRKLISGCQGLGGQRFRFWPGAFLVREDTERVACRWESRLCRGPWSRLMRAANEHPL